MIVYTKYFRVSNNMFIQKIVCNKSYQNGRPGEGKRQVEQ